MKISEVKFYDLTIDSEFKKTKDGNYQTIAKAEVGEKALESVIIIELDKEKYDYVSGVEYKKLAFEAKGSMQVKKNKKDIPFMYFKVNFIMSLGDLEKVQRQKKARIEKYQKINSRKSKKEMLQEKKKNAISWYNDAEKLGYQIEIIDSRKIKFLDKEHKMDAQVEFKNPKELPIVAVKPIDGTDEYKLILGWKGLIAAKLLDLNVRAYVIDLDKKEFLEKINKI